MLANTVFFFFQALCAFEYVCNGFGLVNWPNIRLILGSCTQRMCSLKPLGWLAIHNKFPWKVPNHVVSLTEPVFSSQRSESSHIVLPVPEEIHGSIQSPLEDGPAGWRVKLTHSTDGLVPGFMRPQVINVTVPDVSLLKRVLTVFKPIHYLEWFLYQLHHIMLYKFNFTVSTFVYRSSTCS